MQQLIYRRWTRTAVPRNRSVNAARVRPSPGAAIPKRGVAGGPKPRRGGLFIACDVPTRLFFLFSAARDKGLFTRAVPEADCFPTARLFQDRAAENKKKNWGVGATGYKQATPTGFQQTGDNRNSSSALGDLGNDKGFSLQKRSKSESAPDASELPNSTRCRSFLQAKAG